MTPAAFAKVYRTIGADDGWIFFLRGKDGRMWMGNSYVVWTVRPKSPNEQMFYDIAHESNLRLKDLTGTAWRMAPGGYLRPGPIRPCPQSIDSMMGWEKASEPIHEVMFGTCPVIVEAINQVYTLWQARGAVSPLARAHVEIMREMAYYESTCEWVRRTGKPEISPCGIIDDGKLVALTMPMRLDHKKSYGDSCEEVATSLTALEGLVDVVTDTDDRS
jgi:hypothetical protein